MNSTDNIAKLFVGFERPGPLSDILGGNAAESPLTISAFALTHMVIKFKAKKRKILLYLRKMSK